MPASGIGFAIPSNTVRDIAGQIIQHGRVVNSHRAALGVSLADSLERPGALVGALQPGGPAERAGIVAGDAIYAIYAIAGKDVANAEALATALAGLQPGQRSRSRSRGLTGLARPSRSSSASWPEASSEVGGLYCRDRLWDRCRLIGG